MVGYHLHVLSENLDLHSSTYDKFIVLGDFIVEIRDLQSKSFCDNYSLKSLVKQPKCYKRPTNSTCIDLILCNQPESFQSISVLEIGLSDFHLMTLTVMKKVFKKLKPRIINYRTYISIFQNKHLEKHY